MGSHLDCFMAYDVRGRVPDQLNEDLAYRIGRACAEYLKPNTMVVGRDVRLTSQALCQALTNGLRDGGVEVLDIGLGGTEMVYFATFHLQAGGGVMVTASHNPMDYNGMKLVREGARPISGDSGLKEIERLAAEGEFAPPADRGGYREVDIANAYVKHLLGYVDVDSSSPCEWWSMPATVGRGW